MKKARPFSSLVILMRVKNYAFKLEWCSLLSHSTLTLKGAKNGKRCIINQWEQHLFLATWTEVPKREWLRYWWSVPKIENDANLHPILLSRDFSFNYLQVVVNLFEASPPARVRAALSRDGIEVSSHWTGYLVNKSTVYMHSWSESATIRTRNSSIDIVDTPVTGCWKTEKSGPVGL